MAGTNPPYNPKQGFEWVPAILALTLTVAKIGLVLMPYFAALKLTTEQAAVMASIVTDQGFDMIWASSVTYWFTTRQRKDEIKQS